MNLPGFPEAFVLVFLLSPYGWGGLCRLEQPALTFGCARAAAN